MPENLNGDYTFKNIANVTSPKRSVHHMSELVYDVDYSEAGNAPVEFHEEMSLTDKFEKANLKNTWK